MLRACALSLSVLLATAAAQPPSDACQGAHKDQTSCDADTKCTWCKSAAIPSACYTKADAKGLPSGVFECDSSAAPAPKRRTTWKDLEANAYTYADWLAEHGERGGFPGTAEVFAANLAKIRAHNADPSQTYKMGVNAFTGLTAKQFKDQYVRGYNGAFATTATQAAGDLPHGLRHDDAALARDLSRHVPVSDLPASVDWRTKKVVTPVKNQGMCGSCWAFSTAETLESHVALKTGKLLEFSEQEFVSCSPNPDDCGGTGGCQGSTQWLGFAYAAEAGITTETDYPYRGTTGTCDTSKIKPVANITGHVRLPKNNYTALMNSVASIGPIAISAAAEPWQMYESGVFSNDCGADVDHAIQLVGYGSAPKSVFKPAMDYWLVRNSWGPSWGEDGYIRIERFGAKKAEPCKTDKQPGDGTGCKGGPATIQVCGLCGIMSDSSYPVGGHLL